jgi:cytochrome c
MELTDEAHWGEVFERNGTLTIISMGRKSVGKWRTQKDQLCLDTGKEPGGGCYAQPCHDVGEAAKNKLGPELNGLDGRKAGTAEGYAYSDADKNSGIVWSESSFKEYLENPQEKMPGTKMILSVKNEKEVADLWVYLKQFGADGKKKSQ